MTIKYPNGQTVEAIILSRNENRMRVITRGGEDILEFAKVAGTWASEDLEPVEIQFEWERQAKKQPVTEADCVCSKELAARLIHVLRYGCDADELEVDGWIGLAHPEMPQPAI